MTAWLVCILAGATGIALCVAPELRRAARRWIIARAIRRVHRDLHTAAAAIRRADEAEASGATVTLIKPPTVTEAPAISPPKPPARTSSLPPGRQRIHLARVAELTSHGLIARPWTPPIPAEAHSASWSDVHRFAPGAERQRDSRAACLGQEPPISLVCVGCEMEQPPLFDERACAYCGLHMKPHGSRVFWWREQLEVPMWQPQRGS